MDRVKLLSQVLHLNLNFEGSLCLCFDTVERSSPISPSVWANRLLAGESVALVGCNMGRLDGSNCPGIILAQDCISFLGDSTICPLPREPFFGASREESFAFVDFSSASRFAIRP